MHRKHSQKIDVNKIARSIFTDQAQDIIDNLLPNNILDIEGVFVLPKSVWNDYNARYFTLHE